MGHLLGPIEEDRQTNDKIVFSVWGGRSSMPSSGGLGGASCRAEYDKMGMAAYEYLSLLRRDLQSNSSLHFPCPQRFWISKYKGKQVASMTSSFAMTQQSRPSWLSSFGDYGTYVRNLTASDPRLSQRDPKLVAQKTPWETAVARAVVFHKSPGGKKFSTPVSFDKAPLLSDFLSNNQLSRDPDGQQLIIVEGLNPAFAGALGSHFRMDPSFFVEQMRVIVISAHKTAVGDGPVLPSLAMAREHMTLKYYESLTMPDHVARTFKLCCADSGRHLGVTRVAGQFSSVGMLRRKCSVWRRRRQGGKGWDGKSSSSVNKLFPCHHYRKKLISGML